MCGQDRLIFRAAEEEFDRADNFHQRLQAARADGQHLKFAGTHLDLPLQPTFTFDYRPSVMKLTRPPLERDPKDPNV